MCRGWHQNADFLDGQLYGSEKLSLSMEEIGDRRGRIRNWFEEITLDQGKGRGGVHGAAAWML